VEADVFRPQSVGRAVRTAFVLGVLIVVALVAAFAAVHQFDKLVGDNKKDELGRYLDDNEHTTSSPSGAGFKVDFPVPPSRQSETFDVGVGSVDAKRDRALVDDEITFDVVWFELPTTPTDPKSLVTTLVSLQLHQLGGTKFGSSSVRTIGTATSRGVAFDTVDRNGAKRYYDERIMVKGRSVWVLRVGSQIRRRAAFERFAGSFTLTS
jgi:hypothetical protein